MSMASNTGACEIVRLHRSPPRRRPRLRVQADAEDRDAVVLAQVLGVLKRASPPPDVSWRQVARRLLFFVIAMSLLIFGGQLGGS